MPLKASHLSSPKIYFNFNYVYMCIRPLIARGSQRCPGSCELPDVGDRKLPKDWQCCLHPVETIQKLVYMFFSRKVTLGLMAWFSG